MSNTLSMRDLIDRVENQSEKNATITYLAELYDSFNLDVSLQSYLDHVAKLNMPLDELVSLYLKLSSLVQCVGDICVPPTYTDGSETIIAIGDIMTDSTELFPKRAISLLGDIDIMGHTRGCELIAGKNIFTTANLGSDVLLAVNVIASGLYVSHMRVSERIICDYLTINNDLINSLLPKNYSLDQVSKLTCKELFVLNDIDAVNLSVQDLHVNGTARIDSLTAETILADTLIVDNIYDCKHLRVYSLAVGESVSASKIFATRILGGNAKINAKSITVTQNIHGDNLSVEVDILYARRRAEVAHLKAKQAYFAGRKDDVSIGSIEVEALYFDAKEDSPKQEPT